MWVFLTARLRQWVLLAVLLPLVTRLVRALRRGMEARSGPTRLTRALATVEKLGGRDGRKDGRGRRGRRGRKG